MEIELNGDLLFTELQYHGPKLLQEALGSEAICNAGIPNLPTIFGHSSANDLDSEKQLKLHTFIMNNSKGFFSVDMLNNNKQKQCEDFETNSFTVMPPYEVFGFVNKGKKLKHFLNELSEGEIIITSLASKTASGLILKVLCTYTEPIRCVSDINVYGFCQEPIPGLSIGDNLCCEVIEVIPEAFKLFCGIKGVKCHKNYRDLLGLFNMDNCPQTFKYFHSGEAYESYDSMLRNSTGFKNSSNICNLELITGLSDDRYSILPTLSGSFPEKESALELRKVQSSQWAIQSVSEGIKHFKAGHHSKAFDCLNKALTIDSLNVEAYVARGALHANLSCFKKSFEDLTSALKINPKHVNGRKCLVETMIGYAKTLESQNKLKKALQYYENCLQVIPDHDEAKASIEYLRTKLGQTSSSSSSNRSNCSSSSGSSSDEKSTSFSDSDSEYSSKSYCDESSSNASLKLKKERTPPINTNLAMIVGNYISGGGSHYNSFLSTENSKNPKCNEKVTDDLVGKIRKLLNQTGDDKKKKKFYLKLQRLLQDACVIKKRKKSVKKSVKKSKKEKDKNESHKHKKKDSYLMETQTLINTETNYTEHATFPISCDITNNKGYFNQPLPSRSVPENNSNNVEFQPRQSYSSPNYEVRSHDNSNNSNNMEFKPRQSYSSPNYEVRSRDRSASKRLVTYSRSRSIESHSSQLPLNKNPKKVSKPKFRSHSTSYSRDRRNSSSWSNRSRSYSRPPSCSRSMYHCNRRGYYNNRNRGTYFKPHFQNQYHHNRGFKNHSFQHRGRYVRRPNYNIYFNNCNNKGQKGGERQRLFHYRPRQYDRNRLYKKRSYFGSPNFDSLSRSKSHSR